LNKNTKIWLNSLIGIAISALLIYSLWTQVTVQLSKLDGYTWWRGNTPFLIVALLLVPVNLFTEVIKWKYLAASAQPISLVQAWKSYFAGIALSLVTPNRIGEYPGRILFLRKKNTIRLISVSILGAFAQFYTLFIYGLAGLVYYNVTFPGYWQKLLLTGTAFIVLFLTVIFFRFEYWIARFENIRWLRKFQTYGYLMKRFSDRQQLVVLGLSMLRFLVFSFQYLMLLKWMNIDLVSFQGFLIATLYFWAIAIIPSIAFAELGVRGQVSLFLFHSFTQNTIGILAATVGLWCINLIVPALIGSILLLKVKTFKTEKY